MTLRDDLEKILAHVVEADPSLRGAQRAVLDRRIAAARRDALANAKNDFLLSTMRLLALPDNGHTRLIPNGAIQVLPLRFATIATAPRLLDAAPQFAGAIGRELVSINDVPVKDIEAAAQCYLAGTPQRKRVIGPILLVWPSALERLGLAKAGAEITFRLRNTTGDEAELRLDPATLVPATMFYPRNEHGRARADWHPERFLEIEDFGGSGLLISLPSFFDPGDAALVSAIAQAAELVRSRPDTPLLIDVRGNTGGDFLRTMPLIDAISEGGADRRVGILVDKFTFSAAIVFVAILRQRLGARLEIIGEEMGDGLTFFAEGGLLDLPASGAVVRFSTAFHDWADGRVDDTTPPEIASRVVAAGSVMPDREWCAHIEDTGALEQVCRDVLESWR